MHAGPPCPTACGRVHSLNQPDTDKGLGANEGVVPTDGTVGGQELEKGGGRLDPGLSGWSKPECIQGREDYPQIYTHSVSQAPTHAHSHNQVHHTQPQSHADPHTHIHSHNDIHTHRRHADRTRVTHVLPQSHRHGLVPWVPEAHRLLGNAWEKTEMCLQSTRRMGDGRWKVAVADKWRWDNK